MQLTISRTVDSTAEKARLTENVARAEQVVRDWKADRAAQSSDPNFGDEVRADIQEWRRQIRDIERRELGVGCSNRGDADLEELEAQAEQARRRRRDGRRIHDEQIGIAAQTGSAGRFVRDAVLRATPRSATAEIATAIRHVTDDPYVGQQLFTAALGALQQTKRAAETRAACRSANAHGIRGDYAGSVPAGKF